MYKVVFASTEKPGGKTVTSIALSESTTGPIIWIACNDKSNDQRVIHLENIFKTLRRLDEHSASSRESVAAAVAKDCVNRSYRRVLNYSNRLESKLKELESMRAIDDDIELSNHIRSLLQIRSLEQMCLAFYQFRFTQWFHDLTLRCESRPDGSHKAWQATRHLVGRLGSWHKSTKIVLAQAMENPQLKQNPAVCCVDCFAATKFDFNPASFTIASAVEQTFSARNCDYALDSARALFKQQQLDLDEAFKKGKEHPFQPKVHAEVLMADHFFRRELQFWDGDCYIGCSKPSCFCCDLYLKNHVRSFSSRPCHGNIWINWCPAAHSVAEHAARNMPTRAIVEAMIQKMQHEAEHSLLSGQRLHRTRVESTSGFSGSTRRTEYADYGADTILEIWRSL